MFQKVVDENRLLHLFTCSHYQTEAGRKLGQFVDGYKLKSVHGVAKLGPESLISDLRCVWVFNLLTTKPTLFLFTLLSNSTQFIVTVLTFQTYP